MQGVIFVAPPAAGKGTQSELICDKYGFIHISTGDLLREASNAENLEALYIEEKMASGELVDDTLIVELIVNKLSNLKNKGFILDGFPRNLDQANVFDKILNKININKLYVFNIDVSFEETKKRIVGRLNCPNCKMVYNSLISDLCPSNINYCDECGAELTKRSDDNEEAFETRYNLYLEETVPLINYYREKGLLYNIDGSKNKTEIFKRICEIIENN